MDYYNNSEKRRGTNIETFRGSVCNNSKSREYLLKVARGLKGISGIEGKNRDELCESIKSRMIELERLSKGKTYIIIPRDHKEYKFPLSERG